VVNKIRLRQVEKVLVREYEALLELSDVNTASADQYGKVLRTRSLAAEAVRLSMGISREEAAGCVTDGTGDNGIDAVFVDLTRGRLCLVQSKWSSSGTGSIGVGEMGAFITGFKDLTDGTFSRFNSKFGKFKSDIELALESEIKFEMIVVTSGTAILSSDVQYLIDKLLAEVNDGEEMLSVVSWGLDELRSRIATESNSAQVDLLGVTIENYGQISEPYLAYYGLVDGLALKQWHDTYGDALFDKNIRKALGPGTIVNSSLISTVSKEPEKFWYYNNGVTILCENLKRRPKGASTRNFGEFDLKGASIVNGAQTVASISSALNGVEDDAPTPKVWVRVISLEGCPEGFAGNVTRATNTQNSVENRDFASLDDEQDRLRMDFRLSLDLTYSFKRGEKEPGRENGCTFTDAAIALACSQDDVSLAVIAKSATGRLWDTQGRYYRQLFNSGTSAYTVWRSVQVMWNVDDILEEKRRGTSEGRPKSLIVQGNRMILWGVMKRLDTSGIDDPDSEWPNDWDEVRAEVDSVHASLQELVEKQFPGNYITSLFKNASRCRQLASQLLQ
jgi:AIPR protein